MGYGSDLKDRTLLCTCACLCQVSAAASARRQLTSAVTLLIQIIGFPTLGSGTATAAAALSTVTPTRLNYAHQVQTTAYNAALPAGATPATKVSVSSVTSTKPMVSSVPAPTPQPTAKPTSKPTPAPTHTSAAFSTTVGMTGLAAVGAVQLLIAAAVASLVRHL